MSLREHFAAIQQAYDAVLPDWMADYHDTGNMWNDAYVMDWEFTPIERNVWSDLRDMAMPFYPQMPACGYFLDFGNPFLKIGIECDGKAWHDKERDRVRDARLAASGWMIFRIEGHECVRHVDLHVEYDEDLDPNDVGLHYRSTSEGVLRAIKWAYFGGRAYHDEWMMSTTLFNHRSTPDTAPVAKELKPSRSGPVHISELMSPYLESLQQRITSISR